MHHLQHKADGGKTSVSDCVLLCQFHHDVCIHRRGWRLVLHPDGTTTAYGPDWAGAAQPLTTHHPRRVDPAEARRGSAARSESSVRELRGYLLSAAELGAQLAAAAAIAAILPSARRPR